MASTSNPVASSMRLLGSGTGATASTLTESSRTTKERSHRMMKTIGLVLSVFLLGCSHSMTNAVQAQAGFTNANITGNYAWDFGGRVGSSGTLTTTLVGTGRVFANGAFNGSFSETMADMTSNKITVCSGTISGGYSVNPDGTGTATINTIGSVNQMGSGRAASYRQLASISSCSIRDTL